MSSLKKLWPFWEVVEEDQEAVEVVGAVEDPEGKNLLSENELGTLFDTLWEAAPKEGGWGRLVGGL